MNTKKAVSFGNKMNFQSLEEVAQHIYGENHPEDVKRWVEYWRQSEERNRQLLRIYQDQVPLDFKGKRVLDIGCGTGGLGQIPNDCQLYVGGDYHSHVLQFAQTGHHRVYLQCSGHQLPFSDRTFDYIFAFDVIEHLEGGRGWQTRFLSELKRVLRPRGMIFFATPNFWYPHEGHTGLYFPHYLPPFLRDPYISFKNPGFLVEHQTFSNIKLMKPTQLQNDLEQSGLTFLHDLPYGRNRHELRHHSPLLSCLAALGLGWHLTKDFCGILVGNEELTQMRVEFLNSYYEQHPRTEPSALSQQIDFDTGAFAHQLTGGWHWREWQQRGFRWIEREATCLLKAHNDVCYLQLSGYSPHANRFDVWIDNMRVGEHSVQEQDSFTLTYLIPFSDTRGTIFTIRITCDSTSTPESEDTRELGLMIFSVGLTG